MPVKDVVDLFDTLVKSIVLFNSEIWEININKVLEQFHLSSLLNIYRDREISFIYIYAYIIRAQIYLHYL